MTKSREEILAKARKLKEHATRGVANEKDVAKEKYDRYIKEHGLKDSDVDPEKNNRTFIAQKEDELDLLLTIILSVNPYTRYNIHQLTITCDLDDEDNSMVKKKYAAFVKLWRIEKELLISAFFSKHNKWFTPNAQAHSKWREKNTQNESIKKNKDELHQVAEEWQKMQNDFIKGKTSEKQLTRDVIESQDRVKIMAFNTNRAELLKNILLDANS